MIVRTIRRSNASTWENVFQDVCAEVTRLAANRQGREGRKERRARAEEGGNACETQVTLKWIVCRQTRLALR